MANSVGKTVLVTGGAGYIGSHCVVTLQEAGYDVIALDNFANSVDDGSDGSIALKRVEKITGSPVQFYKCDLLDTQHLEKIFENVSAWLWPPARFAGDLLTDFNCDCVRYFWPCISTTSIRSFILPQ